MFGLFKRAAPKAAPAATRFVRPSLESLEARDCPSTITLAVTGYFANRGVSCAGVLTGDAPNAQVQLYINGQAWCYTTTDADGNWRTSAQAPAPGKITAKAVDGSSDVASAMLAASPAPEIDQFGAVEAPGNWWTFSGHVKDDNYQGEVVRFTAPRLSFINGQSTTVDASGNFSITVQNSNGQTGTVYTEAVNWWGLTSQLVSYTI